MFRVHRQGASNPQPALIPCSGWFCRVDRTDRLPAPLGFDTCRAGKTRIFLRRPTAVRTRTRLDILPARPLHPFSWSFRGRTAGRRSFPHSVGRIHGRSYGRDRVRRRNTCRQDNALCSPPRYALQDPRSRWDGRRLLGRNCTLIFRTRSGKCPRDRTRIASSLRHRKCPPHMVLRVIDSELWSQVLLSIYFIIAKSTLQYLWNTNSL